MTCHKICLHLTSVSLLRFQSCKNINVKAHESIPLKGSKPLNISVSEKVVTFNNTVLNIFNNLIPQETIVRDDKDTPWFNNKINTLIQL